MKLLAIVFGLLSVTLAATGYQADNFLEADTKLFKRVKVQNDVYKCPG